MTNKSYIPILAVLGAIMLLVVAAIAPSQSFLGPDLVYAQARDDATLSGLVLTGVGLDQTFSSGRLAYTARASSTTDRVTVVPTLTNADASFTISPPDSDSLTPNDHEVILNRGANTSIRVVVRSEDRSETLTYVVTVYRERTTPSDNANLSFLRLSDATLSPAFASAKTSYRARARYATNTTTVSYGASDIGAMVEIRDTTDDSARTDDDSATPGHQVNLTAGTARDIFVHVTAEDDTAVKTYKVTIYRENFVKSDNALLTASTGLALTVDGTDGAAAIDTVTDFEFTYDEDTKSYSNVRVANAVGEVTVGTSAAHSGAVAVTRPSDQRPDSDNPGHQVLLRAGGKTDITVVVTAEDGTTTETYSITIYRERRTGAESSDATLSSLRLSGATLSPAFAPAKTSYRGTAAFDTDKTTVSFTTTDVGATVRISDESGTPGTPETTARTDNDRAPGHQVSLTAGMSKVIYLVVTAEGDGPDTNLDDDTKTYQITIYRENFVKSDNALLAATGGLAIRSGDSNGPELAAAGGFTYSQNTMSYPNVRVESSVEQVTVSSSTDHTGAVAVTTPSDQNPGDTGHQVFLSPGTKTDITVVVTAEDGTNTETYSVTIYHERRSGAESSDATLSSLRLSGATLSPAFAPAKTSYNGRAVHDTSKTTVSYMTTDMGAMVRISDESGTPGTPETTARTDDDRAPGHQVSLTAGMSKVIYLVVTAEGDGPDDDSDDDTKRYKITLYRENLPLSDIALLDEDDATPPGLQLMTAGTDGAAAIGTITGFEFTYDEDTKSYSNVRVANSVSEVTVRTSTDHAGAVAVTTPPDQRPDSANPGHQVLLRAGAKTDITVVVTAEDGTTTETYSITIYRERRTGAESSDATLSSLRLSGATLSPAFASAKAVYTGTAGFSTNRTTVSYMTSDVGATVRISDESETSGTPETTARVDDDLSTPGHQVNLPLVDSKVIYLVVTAEGDGPDDDDSDDDTKRYKITIYRDSAASSDATLQSLDLSGIMLSPAFDPATMAYTAEVQALATTTVEAMAAHPGATVQGTGEMSLTVGENTISVTVTAEDETTQTYTVTVTVMPSGVTDLLEMYDVNTNDRIDKEEALTAIDDYIFHRRITKEQAIEVIGLYIFGQS